MSNPNAPAAVSRAPRAFRWLAGIALGAYALLLAHYTIVVAGGSDSSGYLNSARLFAAGKLRAELRAPAEFGAPGTVEPLHFMPHGFFAFRGHSQLTPTYPTGLPLHFTVAAKALGWRVGPFVVLLGAALAAVVLCHLTARELGVSPWLAAAGAAALALCPVFLFTSVQPLSDTLATTWALAAVYCALRARRAAVWAALTGIAFAVAVLVRPTNLLFAPALLVLLGWSGRKLGGFILGGLPGAAWLAFYNRELYGGALRSGYGDIFTAFAWKYGLPTTLHFAQWLALLLPTILLPLALVAWARRDTRRRELDGLALAFGTVTGLYAFYEISHEVWWCLRFILPAVPPLLCAGLVGAHAVTIGRSERARHVLAGVIAAWAIAGAAYWAPKLHVVYVKDYEQAYETAALLARETFPGDALVATCAFSGSLYYYTDLAILRWDQVDAPQFSRYATLAAKAGRPVVALLFDWEEKDAFQRCPGEWTRLGGVRNVALWRLAAPKP